MAYIPIAVSTVGAGGASSITFSNIPQTYTDLVVKVSLRCDRSVFGDLVMQFNSSTTSYSAIRVYGTGSSTASNTSIWTIIDSSGQTANTFANGEFYIPNYTSSNYKSWSIDNAPENNATENYPHLAAGLWSNTAAITSIKLLENNGFNFVQYSSATLYGIKQS